MIPVNVDIHAFFVTTYFIIFFDHHPIDVKCAPDVAYYVGSFLDIVFDQYVRGGVDEETAAKNAESVHCRKFSLGRFGPSCSGHRWELPVLRYHEIMVIYPYPRINLLVIEYVY